MDFIMDRVCKSIGIQVGSTPFTDINYADDAVLFVNKQQDYEAALQSMDSEAAKLGMRISWTKTKIQNLGYGPPEKPVSMNNETVDGVTEFSYLGSTQSSCSNSTTDCERRMGLSASTMQKLSPVWRQKRLSLKTKFRIYASCVLPVLLYGSETWTLPQNAWDKLQAFHMRCQRRILRIKWDDSVSNIEVKKCSGLQKCRLGLFGHVARLPDNVPTNKALSIACQMRNGTKPDPSWKCPRGRPPKTWCHHILHDVNIPADDLLETARDKLRWRSIATADSTA